MKLNIGIDKRANSKAASALLFTVMIISNLALQCENHGRIEGGNDV